ncbi:hypothetical protein [Mycoplasmopsis bovigenitalium]|nr:hypothetical protein [Mycoplasmopsis bovigenitalium]
MFISNLENSYIIKSNSEKIALSNNNSQKNELNDKDKSLMDELSKI